MKIQFHGHTCFSIEENGITLLFDPYNDSIGLTSPSLKADIMSVSWKEAPYNAPKKQEEEAQTLDWPGEYEMHGVHFKRLASVFSSGEDLSVVENTLTVVHWGKMRFCHMGVQAEKLTEAQLEHIGDVDILFLPVGGNTVLSAKNAKEVVEQVEPRLVFPMAYSTEGSTLDFKPVTEFLSEMGAGGSEALNEFKVKRSELPEDNSKVILLEVQN